MNAQINVHKHNVEMHNYSAYSVFIDDILRANLLDAELDKIDVYNLKGEPNELLSGTQKRLVIIGNNPFPFEEGVLITHVETGEPLASFTEKDNKQQLNILLNLFGECNDKNMEVFTHIIKELNTRVYKQKKLDYSWKHTSKKETLANTFTTALVRQQSRFVKEDKERVLTAENYIREYTHELKKKYDQRIRLLNQIEMAEQKISIIGDKLIADLDNIANHPKVRDLYIKDGKFIVHTEPIYAYHDKTGDRYYIGNMRIELNPQETDIHFYGDNPRKSHWGSQCPHPHVSESGYACLGNISATIAELSSQFELYALTLIAIDFLESVNTDDVAGKNIINWDKVDEEGNIVIPGGTEQDVEDGQWMCDCCREAFDEEAESYHVYQSYRANVDEDGDHYNEEYGQEQYVCEECCEANYTWREEIDEYVRDEAYNLTHDEEDVDDEF